MAKATVSDPAGHFTVPGIVFWPPEDRIPLALDDAAIYLLNQLGHWSCLVQQVLWSARQIIQLRCLRIDPQVPIQHCDDL